MATLNAGGSPLPGPIDTMLLDTKMKLGDAIIAATALAYKIPLVTRNVDDFKHIVGLDLINPFAITP